MIKSKSAVLKGIGNWAYEEIEIPEIKQNESLIKTISSGICSTDIYRSMKSGFYSYPIVPGHEMFGYIYKLGTKNSYLKEGDKVCVYPLINKCTDINCCGKLNGAYGIGKYPNVCNHYDFLGSRSNGGYSEFILSPTKNLVKVPNSIDDDLAVFTEPASVALHAFNLAKMDRKFDTVIILGLGPIGIILAAWCKLNKITNVIGVDRNDNRFNAFKSLGYSKIINTKLENAEDKIQEFTNKDGVEVGFECSGSEELLNCGIQGLRKSGKLIVLSNQIKDSQLSIKSLNKVLREEILIKGSWSSLLTPFNEWEFTLETMKNNQLNIKNLISHRFKFSDTPTLFRSLYKKEFKFSKVLLSE